MTVRRPHPTLIYHFTHVDNLAGIAANGLMSDADVRTCAATQVEIGDAGIKEWRRRRRVPIAPGGCVGDYVPFYFAPRSPMMYTLSRGNFGYAGGFDRVVYLVSACEHLSTAGCSWIVSDRNAALTVASFAGPEDDLDAHVDWPLMRERQWGYTSDDPERPDRRAAECLVHRYVPWHALDRIVTKTRQAADEAHALLESAQHRPSLAVDADWYF